MGAVQALGLADLVQADIEEHHIRLFRQRNGLGLHLRVSFAGPGVARLKARHVQVEVFDHVHGVVQPRGVDHGGARPLIPGLLGELADDGHLRPLLQRQDAVLIFQQHDGLLRGLGRHGVVGVDIERLALQGLHRL